MNTTNSRTHSLEGENNLSGTVLVVDDERNIRRTLKMVLEGEGIRVLEACDAETAWEMIRSEQPTIDVLLVDVKLPRMSGIELFERLNNRSPFLRTPPIILISGHATVSDAVVATRMGVFDFFEKPLSRDRVLVGIRNALLKSRADRELHRLRAHARGELACLSSAMQNLMQLVVKVARTRVRVLIRGESGTGKELIARSIHDMSERSHGPFVKVNCAAIPKELIESELFGYERGAFTGARAQKKGLFEVASGGTLLLDEIGDMDLDAQAKVLRVLQSGELMRVGGHEAIQVDVRVLAATHRNLQELVSVGEFREDLYFRLNVVPLEVPSLRERKEDLVVLVQGFIEGCCREYGMANKSIDEAAMDLLSSYHWPGNVRELRNVIERMVVLSDADLSEKDVPEEICVGAEPWRTRAETTGSRDLVGDLAGDPGERKDRVYRKPSIDPKLLANRSSLKDFREAAERAYIIQCLHEQGWNVSKTAEMLGIERSHLHRKIRMLGIHRDHGVVSNSQQ